MSSGIKTDVKKFICGAFTQSGNANAMPLKEIFKIQTKPPAKNSTIALPTGNCNKNHATKKFKIISVAIDLKFIDFLSRDKKIPSARKITTPSKFKIKYTKITPKKFCADYIKNPRSFKNFLANFHDNLAQFNNFQTVRKFFATTKSKTLSTEIFPKSLQSSKIFSE